MTKEQREKLLKLSSCAVSDAMETLGYCGETHGIIPMWDNCPKLVGEALTVKMGPEGEAAKQSGELCAQVIAMAQPGSVIVIDNHNKVDVGCWDRQMAIEAEKKGLAGVAVDGAARDIDHFMGSGFPVFARARATRNPRGRLMEYETNGVIQFCNRQVRPGDVLLGDHSGIVVIPIEILDKVIDIASEQA